jgi:histone H3/H4
MTNSSEFVKPYSSTRGKNGVPGVLRGATVETESITTTAISQISTKSSKVAEEDGRKTTFKMNY